MKPPVRSIPVWAWLGVAASLLLVGLAINSMFFVNSRLDEISLGASLTRRLTALEMIVDRVDLAFDHAAAETPEPAPDTAAREDWAAISGRFRSLRAEIDAETARAFHITTRLARVDSDFEAIRQLHDGEAPSRAEDARERSRAVRRAQLSASDHLNEALVHIRAQLSAHSLALRQHWNRLSLVNIGLFAVAAGLAIVLLLYPTALRHRQQAERELRRSEERYRRLIEDVHLIAWEFDRSSKCFTFVTPQAESLLGYPLAEWRTPEFWYRHVHPEDREAAAQRSREHVARGQDHEMEYRMLRADGSVIWIKDLTTVVPEPGGATRLHGVFIDITQRHRAEEALRESEQHYRALVEQSSDPIYVVCNDRLVVVNRAWESLFGYTREEVADPSFDYMVLAAPESRALIASRRARRARGEPVEPRYEFSAVTREGRVVDLEVSVADVLWQGQRAVQGIYRDITDRKRAQEALWRTQQQYESLVNSIDGIVWEVDPATFRFLFVSRQAERLLGYPVEQWVSEPSFWIDHVHPDDRQYALDFCVTAMREQRNHDFEYRLIARDGRVIWVRDIVTVVVEDGRVTRLRGVMFDVTRQKEADLTLRASAEAQRLLLSELEHRVRNNMSALMGLVDLTRTRSESVDEFAASLHGRIKAMANAHAVMSSTRWSPLRLRSLIRAVAPLQQAAQLELDGADVTIPTRQVTPLGMVLHELLVNSLKHGALSTPAGRVAIAWRFESGSTLVLDWHERGGPAIEREPMASAGSHLIHGMVRSELHGSATLSYPPEGARHRITMTLDAAPEEGEAVIESRPREVAPGGAR